MADGLKPFRWDVARAEQLGSLLEGPAEAPYPGFFEDLADCAARVLGRAADRDLVFVGRSPENLFDYLSGVLAETSWADRIRLLNISNRFRTAAQIRAEDPAAYAALKEHFRSLGIDPRSLLAGGAPVSLVDLVHSGGTFGELMGFYGGWCAETGEDPRGLVAKLGFLGILIRKKTSPNTWRWWQNLGWVREYRVREIRNVTVSRRFWCYLGNDQPKVSPAYPPDEWGDPARARPPREEEHLAALRLAHGLFRRGVAERREFAGRLARLPAMKEAWLRGLVGELR